MRRQCKSTKKSWMSSKLHLLSPCHLSARILIRQVQRDCILRHTHAYRLTDISVRAPFLLSQLAIRLHLASASSHPDAQLSIINMASIAGHKAASHASVYGVSKHALIGLTRNVAVEYAGQSVRCNSISPVRISLRVWIGWGLNMLMVRVSWRSPTSRASRNRYVYDLRALQALPKWWPSPMSLDTPLFLIRSMSLTLSASRYHAQ